MSWYAIDAVDDAIDATRAFLFPFSLGRWARLAVITFFLGAGGVGGQFSNFPNVGNVGDGPGGPGEPGGPGPGGLPSDFGSLAGGPELAVIAGIAVVILLLALLFGVVSAVMEFVFVDVLSRDDVSVREPFRRLLRKGLRLFGFRIALQLLLILPILGVVAAVVLGTVGFGEIGVAGALLAVLVFVPLAITVGILLSFTTQFVVPVMLATDETVLGGWRRLWPRLRAEWKQTIVYFLMHILIGIGVGIVRGFLLLIGAIPVLLVAGILALLAGAVAGGLVSGPFGVGTGVVVAALVGIPLFFLVAVLPVNVLTKTYLRTFELRSLAGFDTEFDLLPSHLFDGHDPSAAAVGGGGDGGGGGAGDTGSRGGAGGGDFDGDDFDTGSSDPGGDSDDAYRSVEDMFDEDDDTDDSRSDEGGDRRN